MRHANRVAIDDFFVICSEFNDDEVCMVDTVRFPVVLEPIF